jgi:hypothetical protein
MRIVILLTFLAAAFTHAAANSITIGQVQFLGTNSQGVSAFKITVNDAGITASALTLANLMLMENGTAENAGVVTSPASILFLAGPGLRLAACPCKSAEIRLSFPTKQATFTLQLANGDLFVTSASPIFFLRPLAGNSFLTAGQSEALVLKSVPEPSPFSLFSGGVGLLLCLHCSSRFRLRLRVRRA